MFVCVQARCVKTESSSGEMTKGGRGGSVGKEVGGWVEW